jgi:hypothetical protein
MLQAPLHCSANARFLRQNRGLEQVQEPLDLQGGASDNFVGSTATGNGTPSRQFHAG